MKVAKPFEISKKLVWQAYLEVKSNGGAAGVDKESIEAFEQNLKNNLYRLWNRLSSGSYFPPAVKAVSIRKKSGGTRILGVPTLTAYCTSYNSVLERHTDFTAILDELQTHSNNSFSLAASSLIQ